MECGLRARAALYYTTVWVQLVQARAGCQPGKEEVPRVPLARLLAVTALTARSVSCNRSPRRRRCSAQVPAGDKCGETEKATRRPVIRQSDTDWLVAV